MYFDKDLVDKIKERSDGHLLEVIEDFVSLTKDRSGGGYHGTCPCCGHASKFTVNPAKGIFKCWNCQDLGGNSPLSFLMKGKSMDYADALKYLADKFNIVAIDTPSSTPAATKKGTFCRADASEIS